jgi:hypothetical protein
MDAEQTVKEAIQANPELRLVLEIAARSQELEFKEPPRTIGMSSDVSSIPVNSACLAHSTTLPARLTRTA